MPGLHQLPHQDGEGKLRAVIEAPQGIEKFFLDTTFFTDKNARSHGWAGPLAASRLIRRSVEAFEKKS